MTNEEAEADYIALLQKEQLYRKALELVRWRIALIADNDRWSVGSTMWKAGQDCKVTLRVIDEALAVGTARIDE